MKFFEAARGQRRRKIHNAIMPAEARACQIQKTFKDQNTRGAGARTEPFPTPRLLVETPPIGHYRRHEFYRCRDGA